MSAERKHSILAPSSKEWFHCGYATRYLAVKPDETNEASEFGTECHLLAEMYIKKSLKLEDYDSAGDMSIDEVKKGFKHYSDEMERLANGYANYVISTVNYEEKRTGEKPVVLIEHLLKMELDKNIYKADDIEKTTALICLQFKKMVEDNGLNRLLYDDKKPKHESAAQLLFLGIADSYCKANNIDLSPETNKGRGAIDFKLSRGCNQKVLVEIKLSSNNQLEHGIEVQLPIYMAQEETHHAIYIIIDNGNRKRIKNFIKKYNKLDVEIKNKIKYFIVDGTLKPSASVA